MTNKLEILKKRLVYRASYRGTKEMDILLSKFVNEYINEFDEQMLLELEKFLNDLSLHLGVLEKNQHVFIGCKRWTFN